MFILNIETEERLSEDEFRELFPSISFPEELTDKALLNYGYAVLSSTMSPEVPSTQKVVDIGNILIDDVWHVNWQIVNKTPDEINFENLRITEIKARFVQMDLESIRPLRAIVSKVHTQEDLDKLSELSQEHATLLAELHAITVT
jgi:hypothetical protein